MTTSIRLWGTALCLGFGATALGLACGNNGNGSGAAPGGPVGGECGEVVAAICNKTNACTPTDITREYGTIDACMSRLGLSCAQFDQWPGTSWTAAKLVACASDIRASSCQTLSDSLNSAACKVTPGSLPNDSPCGDSSQCSGGRCNKVPRGDAGTAQSSLCGVCDTGTSSSCGDAGACTSPQRCVYDSAAGYACVRPEGEGVSCGPGIPCASGLTCKNMVCTKRSGESSPCASSSECDTSIGLACVDGTCQMPVLISPGASCTSLGSRCSGGSDCITAIGADAGPSCVSRAADNAPCNDIYGPRCSSPARCTDGRCVLPDYTQCK